MNDDKLESEDSVVEYEKDFNLYFIDNNDSDKLKLCGVVQSITNLTETRIHENKVDVSGTFSRIRLDKKIVDTVFMRGFLHPKSQHHPFIAIKNDYENNAKIMIFCIWLTKIDYTYQSEDFAILENVNWEAQSIKSEKLDGTPFTLNDAIECIAKRRIEKEYIPFNTQFRIESDGTSYGTKVFFNDEQVGLIQNIKWEVDVENHFPKVTMTVLNVPVSLKIKEEHVNKIIEEYEEDIKK